MDRASYGPTTMAACIRVSPVTTRACRPHGLLEHSHSASRPMTSRAICARCCVSARRTGSSIDERDFIQRLHVQRLHETLTSRCSCVQPCKHLLALCSLDVDAG